MLGKTSVSMMVLLVAASLIGISSIYLYVEGQGPPASTPQPKQQTQKTKYVAGNVMRVDIYTSSDGKACMAGVQLLSNRPNELGIRPGSNIELVAPDESICILFGQSQIGKKIVNFNIERLMTFDALPPTIRSEIPQDYEYIYKVHRVRMVG